MSNSSKPPRRLVRAESVLAARRRRITVVLEETLDQHNLSAVLRTCEAFGIQDVHLVSSTGNPVEVNPAVAIGAERWLTVHRHDSAEATLVHLRSHGYKIRVGHLSADATPLSELPRDEVAAYVFGSERHGVTSFWLEQADQRFLIPTTGFTGSLNLSVAAALVIYDRLRESRGGDPPGGDLSETEKAALRADWYGKLARGNARLDETYRSYLGDPPEPLPLFPRDRNPRPS
jgi:tRNA (guanosine-2'-O-)-methyltransferase